MEVRKRRDPGSIGFPIPIYTSTPIADYEKGGERFIVDIGLTKEHVAELKAHALDESDAELKNNTSDRKRFGEGAYEAWYAKGRTPFALVHEQSGKLAALAWFGAETFEGAPKPPNGKEWHTVAYRSYVPFRGTGLMKGFVMFAMNTYLVLQPHAALWAGIHADNAASIGLGEALGFKKIGTVGQQVILAKES
jgi:RimJ/RimL family protein N-acetyltransferase